MELSEFFAKARHLPKFFRDFHDQKDVMKSFHAWFEVFHEDRERPMPNWVNGHVYVVDYFLKFMALHGWTLQRCKSPVEFPCDIDTTVSDYKDKELKMLKATILRSGS